MISILDIETDSLDPTIIHVAVVKEHGTNNYHYFFKDNAKELQFLLDASDWVIVHNGIDFDLPVLSRLWGIEVSPSRVRDTLVLSRLFQQDLDGGHSLDAWGQRLECPKLEFKDFSRYSEEMLTYCKQDCVVTEQLYDLLMKRMKRQFDTAIECEHKMAYICRGMHENGFKFDYKEAKVIRDELTARLDDLDKSIQSSFRPRTYLIREVRPRLTKFGTIHRGDFRWYDGDDYTIFEPDAEFSVFGWEQFNPGSPTQVIDRLDGYWNPVDKTKGYLKAEKEKNSEKLEHFKKYGWAINERNLATLTDDAPPGAKLLVERLLIASRLRTLETWFSAYRHEDGRIHGRFNSLGTWVHRLSHNDPNMGNVSAEKTIKYDTPKLRDIAIHYGGRMRRLWTCDEDAYLVGCDMEGAHLRLFAHLIGDSKFIEALVNGNKKDGTDPHTINKKILGDVCADRDRAKTFIFSFLNGASTNKVAEIFRCPKAAAKKSLDTFINAYPGLKRLKSTVIPADAARGYFIGFDGRVVFNDSEHHMLAGYLQNGEAVVMKHANILWQEQLNKLGIRYKQVNLVHDEFQTEVYGDAKVAEEVGRIQAEAIRLTGEKFGLKCPLAGEWKIGKNWLETH